ncbi:253_t:CDS:1 [Paraglomus occultum]|uniref:253_t:CDS:1 n=1 Tax=Paraglomus occultum TaxID=144539 RepID=A0A9N9CY77_9GLOM|nr:253_t:CDS:1 [Paraglomus occultum]
MLAKIFFNLFTGYDDSENNKFVNNVSISKCPFANTPSYRAKRNSTDYHKQNTSSLEYTPCFTSYIFPNANLSLLNAKFKESSSTLPPPSSTRPTPYTYPRDSLNNLFKNSNNSWPPKSSPSTVPYPLSLYIQLCDEIPSRMSSDAYTHVEFMAWMIEYLSKNILHLMTDIMSKIETLQPGDGHYEAMLSCLSVCLLSYRWGPLPNGSSTACVSSLQLPSELTIPFTRLTSRIGLPPCPTLYSTILCNWSESTTLNIDGEDITWPLDTRFTFSMRDDSDIGSTTERGFYLSVIRMESMAKRLYERAATLVELVNGYEETQSKSMSDTTKDSVETKDQKIIEAMIRLRHSATHVFRVFYSMTAKKTQSSHGCPFAAPFAMSVSAWSTHAQTPTGWELSGFKGISGSQALIIPVLDTVLSCVGTSPAYLDAIDSYEHYTTQAMRDFVNSIKNVPISLREYVIKSKSVTLKREYNQLVSSLALFRMGHRAIGRKYLGGGESNVEAEKTAGELVNKLRKDGEGTVDTFSRAMTERILETKKLLVEEMP